MRGAGIIVAALLLAGPAAAGTVEGTDRVSGCRIAAPESWRGLALRWEGACPEGRAAGPGVLRGLEGTALRQGFYGRMRVGAPETGVFESAEGFQAGRVVDGAVVEPEGDDIARRNALIRAFDIARDAAQAAAKRFRDAGNAGSAAYYEDLARRLEQQMND
jgi:hypothetical protein